MANPIDLEKLCQGAKAWNAWRDAHPDAVPDLTDANLTLSQRQLGPSSGGPVNLRGANLAGATLRYATLSGADLEDAILVGADLVHARLDGANLTGADLTDAVCDNADLAEAKLDDAVLTGASFANARNLTEDQIVFAHGDASTLLPAAIMAPSTWFPAADDYVIYPEYPEYPAPEQLADEDLYEVLGVARTAKPEAIRAAFRVLVKKLHPDLNPNDDEAQEAFKKVSTAYRILGDVEKRVRYDKGEIGSDGEINPEFEAKRQFRRHAFRFYTAAAMSLLLAGGVLGVVWHAVLTGDGVGRGRVEIAVATPPKSSERLDPTRSDLRVDFRRNPELGSADKPEEAVESKTEILARPPGSEAAKAEAQPDAAAAKADAKVDAPAAKPEAQPDAAAAKADAKADALAAKPEAQPDAAAAKADAKADAPAAKPEAQPDAAAAKADAKADTLAAKPEAEADAPAATQEDGRANATEAASGKAEGTRGDLPESLAAAKPAEGAAGERNAAPETVPVSAELPAQRLAAAAPQATQFERHVAGTSEAVPSVTSGEVKNADEQNSAPGSASPPPGTDAPPAAAQSAPPQDAKVTTLPLFEEHQGEQARPAQADAARAGTPPAQASPAAALGDARVPYADRARPARNEAFMRKTEGRKGARDAISALFRQRAVKQTMAHDQLQATASTDPLTSREEFDAEEEVWELYTHSIPDAGAAPAGAWPVFQERKKEPRHIVVRPPARDVIAKVPAQEMPSAAAPNRKQAVSDILAGGL